MFNSFSAALSALNAHSAAVDAVGNNLANVNTTGFKSVDVAFKDVVAASLSAGQSETGMGVSRPQTIRKFSQGSIQSSTGSLDVALQGSGFFVVNDRNGQRLMTRDGSFQLDSAGYVTTLTGERVQQYVSGALKDIRVPTGATASTPTANLNMVANLNAGAKVGDTFSTPMEVVDSLGARHMLTFQFTKKTDNSWNYDVTIPAADVGKTGAPVSLFATPPTGTIDFDTNGQLKTPAIDTTKTPPVPDTIALSVKGLSDKATDMSIKWSFYDDSGTPLLTQFAQTSSVSKTNQDGYPSAEVVAVGMADGGKVIAKYGNGQEKQIGELAIALVSNPSSLASVSNNNYRVTAESASPVYGTADTGGRGKVKAGALESSNVDIAREFTNLIVYQRGYQASSRVITTSDELSQETLNLKR